MRLTLAKINAEFKKRGIKEILVKSRDGYYYFMEGKALDWHTSSVMTFRMVHDIEFWLNVRKNLAGEK